MWALVESGSVSKVFARPTKLILGDVQYPSNIFELWTTAELNAIKIYDVVQDNTNKKDKGYYINTNVSYAFQSSVTINSTDYTNVVVASYGTATAKALTDTLYTAQDETDGLGTEGEVKTQGLKTQHKAKINSQAASNLSSTDWMTIRETEGGTDMPSNIKTWRASVRTKANSMCTQIDNAADVDALAALYEYNNANPPVRPLGEFPELS
tara:strand:+ start:422 stop:1051 length:630 start_codon:yes stop_codon:yes gene_type:complete